MAKQRSASPQILIVPFPLKGKDVNWARADQPSLTTPDCLNVWGYDRTNRARGAQRPGFTRMWAESVSNDVLYYQCKRCSDDSLADLYVKASEVTPTYRFKWAGDFNCYYILSTNPKTYAPGVVAYAASRTTVTLCNDVSCGSEYNPPAYRRARRCSDSSLVGPYVPVAEIGSYPYYFKWAGDGLCYKVLSTDSQTTAPGITAPTATRTSKVSCTDTGCQCSGCGSFTWETGVRYEPGFIGASGNFIVSSGVIELCTLGTDTAVTFNGTSDDIVVLTKSTQAVTQSYSGTPGDPVTITLPGDQFIFRDSFGSIRNTAEGGNPETCEKVIDDGTHTSTIPAGSAGSPSDYDHVVNLEADGFTTIAWSTPILFSDLDALGWVDADGIARMRFWHIVSGRGQATVTGMVCSVTDDVIAWDTGEELTEASPCNTDPHWTALSAHCKIVDPEHSTFDAPQTDTEWISTVCDADVTAMVEGGTNTVTFSTYVWLGDNVDLPTFEIPFDVGASELLLSVKVNGVSQGLSSNYPGVGGSGGPYNPYVTLTITSAAPWVAGNNLIEFLVQTPGNNILALNVKWGTPTWTP